MFRCLLNLLSKIIERSKIVFDNNHIIHSNMGHLPTEMVLFTMPRLCTAAAIASSEVNIAEQCR